MKKRTRRPDINQEAARIVEEATKGKPRKTPPGLEAAWDAWIVSIKQIDPRTRALLRAAFEAGYESGRNAA